MGLGDMDGTTTESVSILLKKKNPKQQNKQKFPGSHNPRVKFFIVHTSFDRTSEHSCTYLHYSL